MRFLNHIKDLSARLKMAKRAAEEGWISRMTEQQVAKLLSKAHKKSRTSAKKPGSQKSRPKKSPTGTNPQEPTPGKVSNS